MTWIVILAGAALMGLYLLGRSTPEGRMHQPIVEIGFPQWAKVLALIVVVCGALVLFAVGR